MSAPITKIYVGNEILQETLRYFLDDTPCEVEPYAVISNIHEKNWIKALHIRTFGQHYFCRDGQITLPSGQVYVPYNFQRDRLSGILQALALPTLTHFQVKEVSTMGHGFTNATHNCVVDFLEDNHISYISGKTAVEGGNIRRLGNKLLIGRLSVYTSLVALDHQGYFTEKRLEPYRDVVPTDEFILKARNYELAKIKAGSDELIIELNRRKENGEISEFDFCGEVQDILRDEKLLFAPYNITIFDYDRKILSPLEEDERVQFYEEGRVLFAKIAITQDLIASEMQFRRDDAIFLDHIHFHMDEDFFCLGNTVFYHCQREARELLCKVRHANSISEYCSILKYAISTLDNIGEYDSIHERNRMTLNTQGINYLPVAGCFSSKCLKTVNFMNCFTLNSIVFTNGCVLDSLKNVFCDSLRKYVPSCDIRFVDFVDDGRCQGFLTSYFHLFNGGLNCLTWEFDPYKNAFFQETDWLYNRLGLNLWNLMYSYL